jgi:hypothetical protein
MVRMVCRMLFFKVAPRRTAVTLSEKKNSKGDQDIQDGWEEIRKSEYLFQITHYILISC